MLYIRNIGLTRISQIKDRNVSCRVSNHDMTIFVAQRQSSYRCIHVGEFLDRSLICSEVVDSDMAFACRCDYLIFIQIFDPCFPNRNSMMEIIESNLKYQ